MEAGSVLVRIMADSNALTAGLTRASGQMAAFGAKMSKVGMGMTKYLTLPLLAVGAVSIKMASDFEGSMRLIQTQAGGSAKDVEVLSKAVLKLATQGQHGPKELADSLYHLKSVGMDNAQAMAALTASEHLASVGHADLEATTNAVAGAFKSGISGAQNFGKAVGTINSIIGAGNMRMDDFNAAMGTGVAVAAQAFGVSLTSLGASLAMITSRGIPATKAAMSLRMAIMMMGAPSQAAAKAFANVGLSTTDLAKAMRSGGLVGAIGMLKEHLAGLSKVDTAAALTKMFGARSSAAVLTLIGNLKDFQRTQDQILANSKSFWGMVGAQAEEAAAKWKHFKSATGSVAVTLGNVLLPIAKKMADDLGKLAEAFAGLSKSTQTSIVKWAALAAAAGPVLFIVGKAITLFAAFGGIIGTVASTLGAFGAAFSVGGIGALATSMAAAIGPIGWVAIAIAAVGAAFVLAWKHSETFRNAMTTVWNGAVSAIQWAASVIVPLAQQIWAKLVEGARWVAATLGPSLRDLWSSMQPALRETWALVSGFFQTMYNGAVAIVGWFRTNWSTIGPILKAAWDVGIAATKTFFRVLAQVLGTIAALLRGDWKDAWSHATKAFDQAWKGMVPIGQAGSRLVVAILKGLAKLAVAAMKDLATHAVAALKSLPGALASLAKHAMGMLVSAIKGGSGQAVSFLKSLPGKAKAGISAMPGLLRAVGAAAMKGLRSGLQSVWGAVAGFVQSIPGKIKGFFSGAGGWLVGAGAAIFNGLISGMESAGQAAIAKATSIASQIKNAVTGFLGIHSPSTVMMKVGVEIARGLAHGMTKGQREAVAAASELAGNVASVLESALGIGESVTTLGSQGLPTIKVAKDWAKKVAKLVHSMTDAMKSELKKINLGKKDATKNRFGAASEIFGSVASIFSAFTEITPESVAKAMAGIAAAKAQAKKIAKAVAAMVKDFRAEFKKLAITEGETSTSSGAAGIAGDVSSILGSFAEMTVEGITKAIVGMNEAARRAPELAAAMVSMVRSLQTALKGVTTGDEFTGLVSSIATIVGDITGAISSLGSMTEKAIQDGIWGAGWVAKKAMELGDALRKMVGWLNLALQGIDTAALAGMQEKLSVLSDIAGKTAAIVSDLASMTPAQLSAAGAAGFGGGYVPALARGSGGNTYITQSYSVPVTIGTVQGATPKQARAVGATIANTVIALATARRSTKRGKA